MRKPAFAYAKTKAQISFAVTAKLISAFVFATRKVKSLYLLNPKFQASNHLLWLYSPVCVGPGRQPRRPVFSQRGSICRFYIQTFNSLSSFFGYSSWFVIYFVGNPETGLLYAILHYNMSLVVRNRSLGFNFRPRLTQTGLCNH